MESKYEPQESIKTKNVYASDTNRKSNLDPG